LSIAVEPGKEPFKLAETFIEGPGTYCAGEALEITVTESSPPENWHGVSPWEAFIDIDAAPFPWVMRGFSAGDRILPLGMSGHKKVKNIFIDLKIPIADRQRNPLIFSGEKLIWVCGLALSATSRVTPKTKAVVRVAITMADKISPDTTVNGP
jgi:tRNA(Ile)-lysidine synthase